MLVVLMFIVMMFVDVLVSWDFVMIFFMMLVKWSLFLWMECWRESNWMMIINPPFLFEFLPFLIVVHRMNEVWSQISFYLWHYMVMRW